MEQPCKYEFTPETYPPFPGGLPVAELETFSVVDLGVDAEHSIVTAVFEAAQRQGCFYLDFEGADHDLSRDSEALMRALEGFFKMSQREKDTFLPQDPLSLFGYKKVGGTVVDKNNKPDCAEFFNISKNDLVAARSSGEKLEELRLPWPSPMLAARDRIEDLMCRSRADCLTIVDTISAHAGLPPQTLRDLHRYAEPSGDVVRVIRGPPRSNANSNDGSNGVTEEIHTPYHQDFGTVTLLFNWIGGLQTEHEGTTTWVEPPKPGQAIVLVGTALAKFIPGCHAARHRVVCAPGEQGQFARYSMGYFLRPEDEVVLKPMTMDTVIATGEAATRAKAKRDSGIAEQEMTAKQWIRLQARGLGIGREEGEDEKAGRGISRG